MCWDEPIGHDVLRATVHCYGRTGNNNICHECAAIYRMAMMYFWRLCIAMEELATIIYIYRKCAAIYRMATMYFWPLCIAMEELATIIYIANVLQFIAATMYFWPMCIVMEELETILYIYILQHTYDIYIISVLQFIAAWPRCTSGHCALLWKNWQQQYIYIS